jgi:hypothetical protein
MSRTAEQQDRVAKISRTPITMMPVESSQIAAIGHDPNTKTLAIRFKAKPGEERGPLYHYGNVDADLFRMFREAPSVGSFFYSNIKPNADEYPYAKIVEEDVAPRSNYLPRELAADRQRLEEESHSDADPGL